MVKVVKCIYRTGTAWLYVSNTVAQHAPSPIRLPDFYGKVRSHENRTGGL